MEVILLERVEKLGGIGDVVTWRKPAGATSLEILGIDHP